MNNITIMESSVAKWDRIINKKGSDGGILDCPPCRIYYWLVCLGCPIAQHSGKKFCKGTPYVDWYWHQVNVHGKMFRKVYCEECTRLAIDMRDYMIEIVESLKAEQEGETIHQD